MNRKKENLRPRRCIVYGVLCALLIFTAGCGKTVDGAGDVISRDAAAGVLGEAGEDLEVRTEQVTAGGSGESADQGSEVKEPEEIGGLELNGTGADGAAGSEPASGQETPAPDGGTVSGQDASGAGGGAISGQDASGAGGGTVSGQETPAPDGGTVSGQGTSGAGGGAVSGQGTSGAGGGAVSGQGTSGAGRPNIADSVSGALSVEGTQLMDASGRPVQLRGISTHGLAWYPEYVNLECFKQLKEEWGANVVRLAMYTAENGGYCTGGDQSRLKALIKEGVGYAVESGLYVIIDWHILSDGNPNTYLEESKEFFAEISKEYADYTNVLYEICNEPNGGTSWSDVKQYAEEVIAVIRENDKDGIILVGTPNWSQYVDQAAADPIEGYDNIMYTLHFYAATHMDGLRNTMVKAVEDGLPVFVSEYGICDASGNGAIDEYQAGQWIDILNQYQISYVAWNLSNKSETSAVIKSSSGRKNGFQTNDLSDSGKWLYNMLRSAGSVEEIPDSGSSGNGGIQGGAAGDVQGGQNENSGSTGSEQDSQNGNSDSMSSEQGGQNGNGGAAGSEQDSQSGSSSSGSVQNDAVYKTANLSAAAVVVNSWEQGNETFYQYSLTLSNLSETEQNGWNISLVFSDMIALSGGWNGNYQTEGGTLTISCMDYNSYMGAGGSVSDIGFIISGSKELKIMEVF